MGKVILMFFATIFFIGTDTFLISPLLPTLQHEYQITADLSGWLVGAYALGYAIFALVAGPLSDGWNRKKVMAYGMIFFAASTFLCGFATNFWQMFFFRLLAGISSAFVGPQIWAAIPTLFPANQVGKVMGIVMAGLSASQLLGVPLGSWLANLHWSVPFFIIGGVSLLIALLDLILIPDMHSNRGQREPIFARYQSLLHPLKTKQAFFGYFLIMSGGYGFTSLLGNWLTDSFGQTLNGLAVTLLVAGAGNTLGSFFSGWLLDRFGRRTVVAAASVSNLLLFFSLSFLSSLPAVQIGLCLIFFFTGVLVPTLLGFLQTLSPTARGTIASLANAAMYSGALVGSALAGLLYTHVGFLSICLYTCFGYIASLFLFLHAESNRQQAAHV